METNKEEFIIMLLLRKSSIFSKVAIMVGGDMEVLCRVLPHQIISSMRKNMNMFGAYVCSNGRRL